MSDSAIIARLGLDSSRWDRQLAMSEKRWEKSRREMVKQEAQAERDIVALSKDAADKIAKIHEDQAKRTKAAYASADKAAAVQKSATVASIQTVNGRSSGGGASGAQLGLNLSRQAADVGVTAAMGMNPAMIAIQQGPQIADAFAQARMQGLNVAGALRGMVASVLRLAGPGAVLGTLFMGVTKTLESFKLLREANDGLRSALNMGGAAKREALQGSLAASEKSMGDGYWRKTAIGKVTAAVGRDLTGKDPEVDAIKLQAMARDELLRLDERGAALVATEAAARAQIVRGSEREGEIALAQLKTEEKLNALRGDSSLAIQTRHAAMKAAKEQGAIEAEAINRKHDASERALALEAQLLAIKRDGQRVEVYSADAQLSAATFEQNAATTDEEKAAAAVKVQAAKDALDAARKSEALKKAELALELQIAGVANPEARERLALEGKRKLLLEQIAKAKPDEKASLAVSLAENSGQIQALDASDAAKKKKFDEDASQRRRKEIDDARKLAEEKEQAASDVRGENRVLELEIAGHDKAADKLRTKLSFEKQIAAARESGNQKLADELTKQQALTAEADKKKKREASKATLGELAGNARNEDGRKARQAQDLEARAQKARVKGHAATAAALSRRASKIKAQIGGLQDSEKEEVEEEEAGPAIDPLKPVLGLQLKPKLGEAVKRTSDRAGEIKKGISSIRDAGAGESAPDYTGVLGEIRDNTKYGGIKML